MQCSPNPIRARWIEAACAAAFFLSAGLQARANDLAWEVLANFPPGANPSGASGLAEGIDGNFYGTTRNGGASGLGDVYKITPAGNWTEIYAFTNGTDGEIPLGRLAPGGDGKFYGLTQFGGASGGGTFFSITPGGTLTVLHALNGNPDGSVANAGLVLASGGNFYGTTYYGGSNGVGGIFSVTPSGTWTELYSFTNGVDGVNVSTALEEGSDGSLYGTSQYGGTNGSGTIFKITPGGSFTLLYTFTNGVDGAFPNGGLRLDANGSFYGTTGQGGAEQNGTAFAVTPAGALTSLYSFTGGLDGSTPGAPLAKGSDGNYYGTTLFSGEFFGGTAFQLTPAGAVTTVLRFN